MQFNDLGKQWEQIREVCLPKVDELGHDGGYIGGKRVEEFETQFAEYIGTKHAIGVSNGTDGLKLALQSLDLNDQDLVIMPANTFIADYLAVKQLPEDRIPRVAVIDHDKHFCIDVNKLSKFLKDNKHYRKVVVIAVHLYGHACDMDTIQALKDEHFFILMEDCSQSHGTKYKGKMTGSFGDIAVFSLYPGKNLGALGDAGIVTTDNDFLAKKIKSLRNYGSDRKYYYDYVGHNNRLDPIQCIFLSEKLKRLDGWNARKREIANRYLTEITADSFLPEISTDVEHTFHVFCVKSHYRKNFSEALAEKGIPTLIHYPVPIHRTSIWDNRDLKCFGESFFGNTDLLKDQIVSLPIHPFMTEEEVTLVIETVNSFNQKMKYKGDESLHTNSE
jgi:dTDP-4-amino-4,6-dideoxygalactose transaminase